MTEQPDWYREMRDHLYGDSEYMQRVEELFVPTILGDWEDEE